MRHHVAVNELAPARVAEEKQVPGSHAPAFELIDEMVECRVGAGAPPTSTEALIVVVFVFIEMRSHDVEAMPRREWRKPLRLFPCVPRYAVDRDQKGDVARGVRRNEEEVVERQPPG